MSSNHVNGKCRAKQSYLQWLADATPTHWWHDSADPAELEQGLYHKASGVTNNPILTGTTLHNSAEFWKTKLGSLPTELTPLQRTEAYMKCVAQYGAGLFEPQYRQTHGKLGYFCVQVDPTLASDREAMIAAARIYHRWAPNIAVKFPVTAAGLDALEECVAEGITITATVSYTVPQVVAAAQRHRRGQERARQAGKKPGECFAVIMIGRLDDYLRDVARDNLIDVGQEDITQAGLAVSKRAYSLYKENGYDATLLVAALRGTYHMEELAGGDLIMSIHPRYQEMLLQDGIPRELRIDRPIAPEVIGRLKNIPDFVRAYEPDGMQPTEFLSFGLVQRTLTQFHLAGWLKIQSFEV